MTNNVQFNEPDYGSQTRFQKKVSWPTKLVLKLGLAKSEEQAPKILLIIGGIALLVTAVVWFSGGEGSNAPVPVPETPEEIGGIIIDVN